MTEVSFYLVEDGAENAGMRFACRLAEKAHAQGRRLYFHVENEAAGAALDELLWTFRQGSFIPHAPAAALEGEDDPTPVAIGTGGEPPPGFDDVLVNLTAEVPDFFSRFHRTVEIVTPATRDAGRRRYRFYQERGYSLETHRV